MSDIVNGVAGGITEFISNIGAGLLDLVLSLISTIVYVVLWPINQLIQIIFPNLSTYITNFANGLSTLLSGPIYFFLYHIPPMTRSVLLLYLSILVGYYTIIWTYRGIIVIPNVIRKIKFW